MNMHMRDYIENLSRAAEREERLRTDLALLTLHIQEDPNSKMILMETLLAGISGSGLSQTRRVIVPISRGLIHAQLTTAHKEALAKLRALSASNPMEAKT